MKKIFVVVTYTGRSSEEEDQLIDKLNKALDWVKFSPDSWLVWTTADCRKWYERIKPIMRKGENVFIYKVDMSDRAGWMPKSFWNFIREKETKQS